MGDVQIIDKLMMVNVVVSDMPKAKEFYADKLGLKVATDYRQDDDNWWVSLAFPGGGTSITLAKYGGHVKPGRGSVAFYFSTSDIATAHKELNEKGIKTNEVKDDLYGPGSGIKWFNFEDPDGNVVHVVQE